MDVLLLTLLLFCVLLKDALTRDVGNHNWRRKYSAVIVIL